MMDESRQNTSSSVSGQELKEEIRKESGHRLKAEAGMRGLNNSDVAELLKVDVKTVSCYYSGKRWITEEKARILESIWGIRAEYLRGISEYSTDNEYALAVMDKNRFCNESIDNACKNYFQLCGIATSPVVICDMPREFFLKNSEQLAPYLPEDFKIPKGDIYHVMFRYRPREGKEAKSLPSVLAHLKDHFDGAEKVRFEVKLMLIVDGEYRGTIPKADYDRFMVRTRAIVRDLAEQFLIPGGDYSAMAKDTDRNFPEI